MSVFYLDSSALLKRYRTEHGTELVNSLFSGRVEGEVFVTSHITSLEIESVAARALKGRILDERAHGVLLALFAKDVQEQVIALPVQTALISEAAEAARRHALRAADSIHLATALRVKQSAPDDTVVVASDKELLQASKDEGFRILNPQTEDAAELLRTWRS